MVMVVDATLRVVVVVVVVMVVGDLDFDIRVLETDLVVGCTCPPRLDVVDFVTRGVAALSLTVLDDRAVVVFVEISLGTTATTSRGAVPAEHT